MISSNTPLLGHPTVPHGLCSPSLQPNLFNYRTASGGLLLKATDQRDAKKKKKKYASTSKCNGNPLRIPDL